MARRKAKVSSAQRFTGYGILVLLGLIIIGLLVRQARFNPAVNVALRAPLHGKSQAASSQTPAATAALIPEVEGFSPLAPGESFGPDNLSDKIDGKAELYLARGLQRNVLPQIRSGQPPARRMSKCLSMIWVRLKMPLPCSAASAVRVLPAVPLTANAYATTNALFFTQGRFYVEIVADRASEALQGSLEAYATALLAKLPAEGETKDAGRALSQGRPGVGHGAPVRRRHLWSVRV